MSIPKENLYEYYRELHIQDRLRELELFRQRCVVRKAEKEEKAKKYAWITEAIERSKRR